jgi:hypothetical protein
MQFGSEHDTLTVVNRISGSTTADPVNGADPSRRYTMRDVVITVAIIATVT